MSIVLKIIKLGVALPTRVRFKGTLYPLSIGVLKSLKPDMVIYLTNCLCSFYFEDVSCQKVIVLKSYELPCGILYIF